jgi:hypothetical protein
MELFLYEKVLLCPLALYQGHMLNKPRLLPCGYSICLKCLEFHIEFNKVNNRNLRILPCPSNKCEQKENLIEDYFKVIPNGYLLDFFNQNFKFIGYDVFQRYKLTHERMIETSI